MPSDLIELSALLRRQRVSGEALRALQERGLRELVQHAHDHVPYYRERFRAAGVHPRDVRSLEDLARLPITSKDDLRAFGAEGAVDPRVARGDRVSVTTSGTSGRALPVVLSRAEARTRQLVDFRALLRLGVRPRDRIGILGPKVQRPTGWHERFGFFRTTMVRFDLSPQEQARVLAAARPTILWIYPTFLRAVLDDARDDLEPVPHARLLITSAERLDPITARKIDEVFAVPRRTQFYGAIEVGRIASGCPAEECLHVEADRILVELLPVAGGGDLASVVVTALDCRTMPMIRYRLGDLAAAVDGPCSCGSSLPRIRPPYGREWEILQLPSGRLVPPLLVNRVLEVRQDLERYRVVQTAIDHFRVEVAPSAGAPDVRASVRAALASLFGEDVRIDVEIVRFSSLDATTKFKAFVGLGAAAS